MRRTFPLLATIAAEVAALFAGAPAAVADTTAPQPVAVAQPEAARAEPPAPATPDPAPADPAPEAPADPVEADPGAVDSAPPVAPEQPTFTVRTGRVGDPAAIATSLGDETTGPASSSTKTTKRRAVGSTPSARATEPAHGSDRGGVSTPITPVPAVHVPVSASAAVPTSSASSHVVVAGDNLWDLAATHLASVTGRDVAALTTAEIVRYWVRVCDDNRAHVRSGNVSLIYAGEIVELPAL